MESLFPKSKITQNDEYLLLRDSPLFLNQKKYCEDLWNYYHSYADPDIPDQFIQDMDSRFWEMYLGVFLLDKGFNLIPKRKSLGSDIQFIPKGKKYFVEAVAPGKGTGRDSVPGIQEHERFDPIPDEKIILRFTNVISKKQKQYQNYIHAGLIGSEDILIIAINGGKIGLLMFDESSPHNKKIGFPDW